MGLTNGDPSPDWVILLLLEYSELDEPMGCAERACCDEKKKSFLMKVKLTLTNARFPGPPCSDDIPVRPASSITSVNYVTEIAKKAYGYAGKNCLPAR
jgi:hypothetical protein